MIQHIRTEKSQNCKLLIEPKFMSYDSAENSLTKGLFILFVSFQTELDSLHVK